MRKLIDWLFYGVPLVVMSLLVIAGMTFLAFVILPLWAAIGIIATPLVFVAFLYAYLKDPKVRDMVSNPKEHL